MWTPWWRSTAGYWPALKHPFPVVLAAHSMGFLEALHWASKYPEEISALVGLDPATPDAYQNMDLASVLHHLEHLGRPDWEASHTFPARFPLSAEALSRLSSGRPGARRRRNFASIVWINEAKALPHSIRQIRQEGPPASVPTLFLLSNGKGTPLPKEEWRMCARNYLSAFSTSSFHLFELPHDLYRQRPKEIADTVHRFLLDHL